LAFSSISNNTLYEYDPTTGTWTDKLNLTGLIAGIGNGREGSTLFAIGDYGYFMNGLRGNSEWIFYNDVYQYDPVSNSLRRIMDYPGRERSNSANFVIGNKAYIGTGIRIDNNFNTFLFSDFYEFDPSQLKD
jgi:N-acetylneuraminic acid mutarotase